MTLPPVVLNPPRVAFNNELCSNGRRCGKLVAYARRLSPENLLGKNNISPPEQPGPRIRQFRRKRTFSESGVVAPVAESVRAKLPLLTALAQSYQHLLCDVAEFAVGRPQDAYRLCYTTSRTLAAELQRRENDIWGWMYLSRWPAFHDGTCHHYSDHKWCDLYRRTLAGHHVLVLEVFNRMRSRGFVMSAMPAWVSYVAQSDGFLVTYMSASLVPSELIPASEGARLRFCPADARHLMLAPTSGLEGARAAQSPRMRRSCPAMRATDSYAFEVLQGYDHLVVGQGVELQWKMQSGSPFGWWFAILESLRADSSGGDCATAVLTFPQFPCGSQCHRLEVRFGDNNIRNCQFGGFTGGLRCTSSYEQEHWQQFMPHRFPLD